MNRRHFIAGAAGVLSGCRRSVTPPITGRIVGARQDIGHLLRNGALPAVSDEERVPVVIVGAGIAGLSAGWRLQRKGISDFRILDLDSRVGGNSRWDANSVSAYPWGAHYVPLPTQESVWVRELFEELGVIVDRNKAGEPVYNERYLCATPQERLFIHGHWQDGLLPTTAATSRDRDEFKRFADMIAAYTQQRSSEGRKAFAIPLDLSSQESALMELDRLSMAEFLQRHDFQSDRLRWYVDYACRDDYGARHTDVSAWAGLHYFASRDASDDDSVLTWPAGNGWIVERLEEKLARHITTASLAYRIEQTSSRATVDVYNTVDKSCTRISADEVIFAAPTFLARHIVAGMEDRLESLRHFEYAPWLVANLTLEGLPKTRSGSPLAWDNVIYASSALGYVVATHQSLATHQRGTVLTYYRALADGPPGEERRRLDEMDWNTCVEEILSDLERPHPDIREVVRNVDIMKWGHAMIRPKTGFIWGPHRRQMTKPLGRIHFANSDLSGLSIFEEAQFRGITAADTAIRRLAD